LRARGTKELKGTQAYPIGFGLWHAMEFHKHISSIRSVTLGPLPDPGAESIVIDDMGCFADLDTHTHDLWHNNLTGERAVSLTLSR
jgi:hypothetical protein